MATAVREREYLSPSVQVAAQDGYEEDQLWFVVPISLPRRSWRGVAATSAAVLSAERLARRGLES